LFFGKVTIIEMGREEERREEKRREEKIRGRVWP